MWYACSSVLGKCSCGNDAITEISSLGRSLGNTDFTCGSLLSTPGLLSCSTAGVNVPGGLVAMVMRMWRVASDGIHASNRLSASLTQRLVVKMSSAPPRSVKDGKFPDGGPESEAWNGLPGTDGWCSNLKEQSMFHVQMNHNATMPSSFTINTLLLAPATDSEIKCLNCFSIPSLHNVKYNTKRLLRTKSNVPNTVHTILFTNKTTK